MSVCPKVVFGIINARCSTCVWGEARVTGKRSTGCIRYDVEVSMTTDDASCEATPISFNIYSLLRGASETRSKLNMLKIFSPYLITSY